MRMVAAVVVVEDGGERVRSRAELDAMVRSIAKLLALVFYSEFVKRGGTANVFVEDGFREVARERAANIVCGNVDTVDPHEQWNGVLRGVLEATTDTYGAVPLPSHGTAAVVDSVCALMRAA